MARFPTMAMTLFLIAIFTGISFDLYASSAETIVDTDENKQTIELTQQALTLDQIVSTALANNPDIAANRWDVAATAARQQNLEAGRWPILSAEGSGQYFLDDQRLISARFNGEPGTFDQTQFRSDLVLRLPLFTGGRITSEIAAAELLTLANEKRLARSREELVFNLTSLYNSMLSQREVIRSLEFSVVVLSEHQQQVAELVAAQKAAQVDLLRTGVRLADLQQSLVREKNILAIQKRLLVNLMGIDVKTQQVTVAGALTLPVALPVTSNANLTLALQQRSDYLAAKSRLEAQSRQVDAAGAGRLPTVSLTAAYGLRANGSNDQEDTGSVMLALSVPLFDSGRVSSKVNQERAILAAARERLRKLELQIRQEIETAMLDIQASTQRVSAIRQAIDQAKETVRIERLKYDLGSGSLTDMLDAQSALLQTETNYARALADYHVATARLKLATGETL